MNALYVLLNHAASTMPDSTAKRRELLLAMLATMKANHPLRSKVEEMFLNIERNEQLQQQLTFGFSQILAHGEPPTTKTKGNGK